MPYRRRYRRGKFQRKSTKAVAYKALKLAKKAYRLPELKNNAVAWAASSVSSTGSIEEISTCSAGSANNQHIGDLIKPTSLKIRGTMNLHASGTSSLVRLIVFRWVSGLMTSTTTDILANVTMNGYKTEDKRFQSEILYDRVFRLNSVDMPELFFQKKIKLKHQIGYAQGAGVANRNGIGYLIFSDEATNTPTVDIRSRMWFRDV